MTGDRPDLPAGQPPSPVPAGVGVGFPACARDCQLRSEADHRIANHLTLLSSYARLKSAEFDGEGSASHASVRLLTRGIDAQIRAVARLHRLMMVQGGGGVAELSPLLQEICEPFTGEADPSVVLVEDFEDGGFVSIEHVLPIGQIVGEAITNAMKYAFAGAENATLVVRSRRTDENAIRIEIVDNGPGLPPNFDPDKDGRFGFNLMRSISRGLQAALRFHSSADGLRVSLTLPAAPPP